MIGRAGMLWGAGGRGREEEVRIDGEQGLIGRAGMGGWGAGDRGGSWGRHVGQEVGKVKQ